MSPTKKRKRDSLPAGSDGAPKDIDITVAPAGDLPPILATFHGITLPPALQLIPYIRRLDPPPKRSRKAEEFLLHGATPRVHYEGRELPEDTEYRRNYLGIFDPATNSVELHIAPKVHFSRTIKAHLERDREVDEKGVVLGNMDSRTALGKEFGTKKSQRRLRDLELNKIDVSDMDKTVTTSIVSQVEANTKDMPTTVELGTQLRDSKPIPRVNHEAQAPEEVYDLEDIISNEEWNVIWVREWEAGEDLKCNSSFVQTRIQKLGQDKSKKHTKTLKILKYISYMIDFYLFQQRGRGRIPAIDRTRKALSLDHVLMEGFLRRYTEITATEEKKRGDFHTVSPALSNKLLYYMAVLCLMVDQYDVDIYQLRVDLGLLPKELVLAFKEVGCSVKDLTKQQFTAMNMTKAEALQHKRAVLKIPLEFPKPPARRASRR